MGRLLTPRADDAGPAPGAVQMSMVGAQQPAAGGWGKARQTVKRNSIMFNLLKRNSKASAAEAAPRKIGWLSFLSSKPASEAGVGGEASAAAASAGSDGGGFLSKRVKGLFSSRRMEPPADLASSAVADLSLFESKVEKPEKPAGSLPEKVAEAERMFGASFGVLRNVLELLFTQAEEREEAQQDAGRAEAVREAAGRAKAQARLAAAAGGAVAGGAEQAAGGAAAAWRRLEGLSATFGQIDDGAMCWALKALELPVDAAALCLELLGGGREGGEDGGKAGERFFGGLQSIAPKDSTVRAREASDAVTPLLSCVTAASSLRHVSAGAFCSFAVGDEGALVCWGRGEQGELAVEDAAALLESADGELHSCAPLCAQLGSGVRIVQVSASLHVLALTAEGEVFAWGSAAHGALGIAPREVLLARLPVDDEGMSFQPRPSLVERLRGRPVRCVAAAEQHSLATTLEGAVFSWGSNELCRLGLPPAAERGGVDEGGSAWQPTPVLALDRSLNVLTVAAGREHSLCASAEGKVWVWGAARYGRLGIGPPASLPQVRGEPCQQEPRLLQALREERATSIAAGAAHSLALCEGGRVYAWGLASAGRLGHGVLGLGGLALDADYEEEYAPLPLRVAGLDGVRVAAICAGSAHSFAVTAGGEVLGWGLASHGRLGLGRLEALPEDEDGDVFVPEPTPLHGLRGYDVAMVSAGDAHALALTRHGQLLSWGMANCGRLGFSEGALRMPRETDGAAYQPLPRQIWPAAALPSVAGAPAAPAAAAEGRGALELVVEEETVTGG